jgi:hypothetical protein
MNRRKFIRSAFLTTAISLLPTGSSFGIESVRKTKPNIIVIFTDDQGFADLGCQKQRDDILTPHIDALARDGV